MLKALAKGLGQLINAAYVVGALLLIGTGLYVSFGRELVPWVAEYRAEVEALASEKLKLPVSIAQLNGRWEGLAPVIELKDVRIGHPDAELHLDSISVLPALWQSVRLREVALADIRITGLHLFLQQTADGAWRVQGLPVKDNTAPAEWRSLYALIQRLSRFTLIDSQLSVAPWDSPSFNLNYANARISNGPLQQRLDAKLLLPDGQPIALSVRAKLDAKRWQDSTARLFLDLPQTDWAKWLPPTMLTQLQRAEFNAAGKFWLNFAKGDLTDAAAQLSLNTVISAWGEAQPVRIQGAALQINYQQGAAVQLSSQGARINGQALKPFSAALLQDQDAQNLTRYRLGATQLELEQVMALLQALAPLPEPLPKVFAELNAHGVVRDIALRVTPQASLAERVYFTATLDDVTTQASHGAPTLAKVNGKIAGGITQGALTLDTQDFVMHLDRLFPTPWHYAKAQGTLEWRLDEQAFSLLGQQLTLEGDEGLLAGDFMIRLMRDRSQESYMDLRVALREGDARYTEKYLPTRSTALSPALSQWLATAIKGGVIEQGFFTFQGALRKDAAAHSRVVSLFFNVQDAKLAYQPGWPALTQASAQVLVEPDGVIVTAQHGTILSSRVRDVEVKVPRAEHLRLALKGHLQSHVEDALTLLQTAPIGTQKIFENWQGAGDLSGHLSLDLPLTKSVKPAQVVVDFRAEDALLNIANPDLELKHVQGDFRFDNQRGLSAKRIQAQVFNEQVTGRINAIGQAGHPATRLEAQGHVSVKRLGQWLGVDQSLPAAGRIPYNLGLILDGKDSQLTVDSTLKGVTLELPEPLAKTAEQVRPVRWQMTLEGAQRRYWLEMENTLSLAAAAPTGNFSAGRGELRVGGAQAKLPVAQGFWLRGEVHTLALEPWQALYKRYAPAQTGKASNMFKGAELNVKTFEGFGMQVTDLAIGLRPTAERWMLSLDSRLIKGQIGLPAAANMPLAIDLEYLRFKAPEKPVDPSKEQDALAGVDPKALPSMDVAIDELSRGTKQLGHVNFRLRPTQQGARLEDIDLDLMGLGLSGEAIWTQQQTTFKGAIEGQDLAEVLRAWDYAPSASSQRFAVEGQGTWPGSPLFFGLKRYSGTLNAHLQNGQLREVQGGANALRIFGLLNFGAIGRRLRLDFSDLLGKGLSYDRFEGVLHGKDGIFHTQTPMILEGPSTNLEFKGRLDMVKNEVDAKLLVALPISNNLPLAGLMIGAPAIGGALFVVDKLLGEHVSRFASVQYDVTGPLGDPKFNFDKPFEKAH